MLGTVLSDEDRAVNKIDTISCLDDVNEGKNSCRRAWKSNMGTDSVEPCRREGEL